MNNSRIITTSDGSKQLVAFSKIQQKVVRQNIRSEDEYLNVSCNSSFGLFWHAIWNCANFIQLKLFVNFRCSVSFAFFLVVIIAHFF